MKENRILCIEVSGECQHLMTVNRLSLAHLCGSSLGLYCTKNISWKPITKDACKNCKEGRYQGFTREQAIERMAKAICVSNMEPDCLWECETCDRWKESDKEAAEAALNALLESNDNEK